MNRIWANLRLQLRLAARSLKWFLLGSTLVFLLLDTLASDKFLLQLAENLVQQALTDRVIQLDDQLTLDARDIQPDSPSRPIVLIYSRANELLYWNTNRFILDSLSARMLMRSPTFELFTTSGRAYFVLKVPAENEYRLCLLPLYESYPIRNEFLHERFFLTPFSNWSTIRQAVDQFRFSRNKAATGIQYVSPSGHYLGTWVTHDARPFRNYLRGYGFFCLTITLLLWAFLLFKETRRRLPALGHIFFWIAILTVLRFLMIGFHFPQGWIDTDLFSSRLLAVNELAPSLGDLTLNVLCLLFALALLASQLPVSQLLKNLARMGKSIAYLFWFLTACVVVGQYLLFVWAIDDVVNHTKIYIEFTDLSRIDFYSLLLGFNLGVLLWILFAINFGCILVSARLFRMGRYRIYEPMLAVGASLLMIQLGVEGHWITSIWLAALYGLALLTLGISTSFRVRFSFVQVVLLLGLFAVLTNYALTRSAEWSMPARMARSIQKFKQDRDIIQEYNLDGTLAAITADSLLWNRDSVFLSPRFLTDDVLSVVLTQHLQPVIRGYDVVLTAFDTAGNRLDNQYEIEPVRPDSANMKPALGQGYWLAQPPWQFQRYMYMAQLELTTSRKGKSFRIQIELYPKVRSSDRVYPRLLDETSHASLLPNMTDYGIAVYINNRLVHRIDRQWDPEQASGFPVLLNDRNLPTSNNPVLYSQTEEYHELMEWQEGNRILYLRAKRRGVFQNITSLSILFYFFFLLYLIYRIPGMWQAMRSPFGIRWYNRLDLRIQILLLALSLLPIVGVWFLTSSFFRDYFYQTARKDLQTHLEQVSNDLQSESSFMYDLRYHNISQSASSRDLLRRISSLIGCDLNLYGLDGRLMFSTIPRIYHTALTSPYIDPDARAAYESGLQSERLQTETIGRLTFQSGYLPLLHIETDEIVGLLNIPYVAQQDLLSFQIERFFAYLINLYVLLFLIVLLIGMFITRTLTRPLDILRAKMEQMSLATTLVHEPIDWASRDEIGALIGSYNSMLGKLDEKERMLAQNERELAWREMARQIAHEIKNPLTPMKLSIQHMIRILERINSGEHKDAIQRISQTLLSQIDSLTAIASTFSQFATMPIETRGVVSLGNILQDIFNLYAEADEAELSIRLPDEDLQVLGDKNQIGRILVNIVKNALQAMEKRGQIHLSLYESEGKAVCKIADNGKGIPADIQDKIFQPNFSTKTSGMGLGLAITRRIVEGMGGQIRFESREGKGTTFYLELPINQSEVLTLK